MVAETCDRVAVMYAGQIVEEASVLDIFRAPKHPYTVGLLSSVPGYSLGEEVIGPDGKARLKTIPGMVPNLLELKKGCRFYERCFKRQDQCLRHDIELSEAPGPRSYRCLFPEGEPKGTTTPKSLVNGKLKEVSHG